MNFISSTYLGQKYLPKGGEDHRSEIELDAQEEVQKAHVTPF